MKRYFIMGSIVAIGLILSAGFLNDIAQKGSGGIFPHQDVAAEKRLAAVNRLDPAAVSVTVSSFKADYVEVVFREIPPGGIFKIDPVAKRRSGRPLFLHFTVPGGDISAMLSQPDLGSITKTGDAPIICPQLQPNAGNVWSFRNFSMADMRTIAAALSTGDLRNRRIIDLTPQDGVVDWEALAAFPPIGWRLHGVGQWRNGGETELEVEFLALDADRIELPRKLKCEALYAGRCEKIELSGIDRIELRTLQARAGAFSPGDLAEFTNLEQLSISGNGSPVSLATLPRLEKLRSLEFKKCILTDPSRIRNLPSIYDLKLEECRISEDDAEFLKQNSRKFVRSNECELPNYVFYFR